MGFSSHRSDANQKAIVKALRDAGCTVKMGSQIGGGFPDLVVGVKQRDRGIGCRIHANYLLEVKSSHSDKLTPDQVKFHESWAGPIFIVTNIDEALIAVGLG